MDWHYETDSGRRGPVSEAELIALTGQGEIAATTRVWRESMPEWRRFADVAHEIAGGTLRPCSQCGRFFPESDVLRYAHLSVCAACKPEFLQKLQEGARVPGFEVWRAGKKLVMYKDAELPARCVKCNEAVSAADHRLKLMQNTSLLRVICRVAIYTSLGLAITWADLDMLEGRKVLGWNALLIILIIVENILLPSRVFIVEIGMCEIHKRKLQRIFALALAVALVGLLITFSGGVAPSGYVEIICVSGVGITIAASIFAFAYRQVLSVSRVEGDNLWLQGCCNAYLDDLPDWPGK